MASPHTAQLADVEAAASTHAPVASLSSVCIMQSLKATRVWHGPCVLVAAYLVASPAHAQRADSAQTIAPVVTTASAVSARLLSVGFEERRRTTGLPPGQFITRQQIERSGSANLREVLNGLGARARGCASGTVYLDGVLAAGGVVESEGGSRRTRSTSSTNSLSRNDQLDRISPRDIEGMEVYIGSSQIPIAFRTSGVQNAPPACVIVVWFRSS